MATTQSRRSPQHPLGQQLLQPLEDAMGLARRYRDLEAFRDYVAARWKWVGPACLLLAVTALACGAAPIALLVGTQPAAALAGLLLAPVVLAGSSLVLLTVFFAWLEERAGPLIMRLRVFEEERALVFDCIDFLLRFGPVEAPLPLVLTPGRIRVEHHDYGEGRFAFTLEARHPWFGVTFRQICELHDVGARA